MTTDPRGAATSGEALPAQPAPENTPQVPPQPAAPPPGGPPLTPEQAGQAITSLVTSDAYDQDAYLLTAAGLRPLP